jgi:3-phosphoshikimate 1-carboxyvinyltransferase
MQNKLINKNTKGLKGEITIPADKSISHRAVMFSSLAKGQSIIENFSKGADCHSTLSVFKSLGVDAEFKGDKTLIINSKGLFAPKEELYCGNSGTTMRLMSGILAGQGSNSVLTGDSSLSKRPMARVIEPLTLMGANIISDENKAPLKITGAKLKGIDYMSKLASAQVKSCVLLAGLFAEGKTSFTEPHVSRNHTELMLEYLGANIEVCHYEEQGTSDAALQKINVLPKVTITQSELQPKNINIVGDISSAAFFIVAGLIVENSDITLKNVGLNPTRTGILDVVEKMGGHIDILDKKTISNEEVGDLRVKHSELNGCVIESDIIPRLIDELPVIAVLASQAKGTTVIKDAGDLRNKESDRIKAVVVELKKIGVNIEETPDGFIIEGKTKLTGGATVETYHDHRLAMSLYVAGLICEKPILINEFDWVNISFPEFEELMENLG